MRFFKENKKYVLIASLTLFVIFSTIIFIEILNNGESFIYNIKNILNAIVGILSPFLIGFFLAFMLNPPSKYISNTLSRFKIFSGQKNLLISLLITYILFIGTFILIIRLILPAIVLSLYGLGGDIYDFVTVIQQDLQKTIYSDDPTVINTAISFINEYTGLDIDINNIFTSIVGPILNWAQSLPNIITQVITSLFSFIGIIFNSILAIIISFYFLMDREVFINYGKKITIVLFNQEKSDRILYIASVTNSIFQKFLIGKALDSLIIGLLFFVITQLLSVPYALLFSVIIGITNMIPYFGPFIGAVPVVGLLLIIDFKIAIITLIVIMVLQQFDGIYLGPKILGESTGIRPIGIVFAVSIGGSLFGSLGMLLGVPVFATISYFFNEYIEKRHEQKFKTTEEEYYQIKRR